MENNGMELHLKYLYSSTGKVMATKPSQIFNLKEENPVKRENKDREGMFGFST